MKKTTAPYSPSQIATLVETAGIKKVAYSALQIAQYKITFDFGEAFIRGVLCNALVCLAIWLNMAAHSVAGKILAIIFPIPAFVALVYWLCYIFKVHVD